MSQTALLNRHSLVIVDYQQLRNTQVGSKKAVRYEQEIPDIFHVMAEVHKVIDPHEFDRTIHHLVQLRSSQVNRCGFCI